VAPLAAGLSLEIAANWLASERPTKAWASRYTAGDEFESVIRFLEVSRASAEKGEEVDQRQYKAHQVPVRDSIFICYRREDSGHAADRINEGLVERFGKAKVFYDVDTIPSGIDYAQFIKERLETCAVLLAIIGDFWVDIRYREGPRKDQRRLEDPADLVRLEIEAAFGSELPVIPVFVGRGPLPIKEDLPTSLQPLASLNFASVGAGPDFRSHFERLLETLDEAVGRGRIGRRLWTRFFSMIR
jgi:hypothetical protein